MASVKSEWRVSRLAGFGLLAAALGVGCTKNGRVPASRRDVGGSEAAEKGAGAASAQSDAALAAAGKAVFDANGCARCHSIGGQGGRMGPDLTRVGAEPGHTPQWLVEHVKNPKRHNPSSRMPAFEGRISDRDLLALGAYLGSLK
jgi:mono/diheme cytochrome c family protein